MTQQIRLPSVHISDSSLFAFGDANLLWSIDDSCVVAELQRSNDSSGQREQQVACYLLVLLRKGGDGEGARSGSPTESGDVGERKGTEREKEDKMKPEFSIRLMTLMQKD